MRMRIAQDDAPHEKSIDRFIRRVVLLTAIRRSLISLAIFGFTLGLIVLSMKAASNREPGRLVWLLLGIIPCVLISIILALRRRPQRAAVRAMLDLRNGCGGLLMARERLPLGEWEKKLSRVSEPRLRLRASRPTTMAAASVLFLAGAFFIPLRPLIVTADSPLDIARETQELASDIELLKKEEIVKSDEAASLEEKLDSAVSEAKGEDPVKTWEALDHLQAEVSKLAQESADKMARENERLGQAQALSEALSSDGSTLDSKLMSEAMKELQSRMQTAAGDSESGKSLPSELKDGLKSGSLSREQMKQLSQSLKQMQGGISKKLGELRDARMIDTSTLKQCENAGKCDGAGLAQFLKENAGKMLVGEMMDSWGKGGINRGRADAPMTWTDPSTEKGAKFKEQVLPSSLAGLKDSQLVGRSTGAPDRSNAGAQQTGALRGATAGGGSAVTQTILPRHRATVNRYFERR